MTHHMLADTEPGWRKLFRPGGLRHAFLIRDPVEVVASYVQRRGSVTLDDIGVVRQAELFDRVCDLLGAAPPVVDGRDVLADPEATLGRLCRALGVPFTAAMLRWPPGPRPTDGVWALHWYRSVEASTGFGPPPSSPPPLEGESARVAEAALPFYDRLKAWRL